MGESAQGFSSPYQTTLIEAIEANQAEEMACLARVLPGGELHEDAEMSWFFTGRSGFNGVLRTSLTGTTQAAIDARISATLAYFQQRNVRIGWPIGPLAQPANIASYLLAHGLIYRSKHSVMALDIPIAQPNVQVPGLTIQEIRDDITLQQWSALSTLGFASTEEISQTYYEGYCLLGFGDDRPWHHYMGRLHGAPIATASLLLHAGVAGIYGIATHPEARHRGIGTAMTVFLLHEIQRLGYKIAILSPTEMGLNMYRRLGFQECYTADFYHWTPDDE